MANAPQRQATAMPHLPPGKTALAFGLVLGIWHVCWAALVAAGLGKALLDFLLRLHFLELDVRIAAFSLATAAMLVTLTAAAGAAFGLLLALIWNWVAGRRAAPSDDLLS